MTIGDCFDYIAEFAEMENQTKKKLEKQTKRLRFILRKGEKMAGRIKSITIEIGGETTGA